MGKFNDYLVSKGAEMIHKEDWGLKKLAYPIQKKKSGFYHLFEYKVSGEAIAPFELEFRRDDSVMRYLTVKLDKHTAAWAEKRKARVTSEKKKKKKKKKPGKPPKKKKKKKKKKK